MPCYPSLITDLKFFNPGILLCLDDILIGRDTLLFSIISLHSGKQGSPFLNPLASPCILQDQIMKQFPKTRFIYCEVDPLADYTKNFIWRLHANGVDTKATFLKGWCHGVLSFDLGTNGVEEAHRSVLKVAEYFKEIFDAKNDPA